MLGCNVYMLLKEPVRQTHLRFSSKFIDFISFCNTLRSCLHAYSYIDAHEGTISFSCYQNIKARKKGPIRHSVFHSFTLCHAISFAVSTWWLTVVCFQSFDKILLSLKSINSIDYKAKPM